MSLHHAELAENPSSSEVESSDDAQTGDSSTDSDGVPKAIRDLNVNLMPICTSARSQGIAQIMASEGKVSAKHQPRLTSNIKTLILAATLFISITIAQAIAARIAHSQALMVDCISMGVDGATFFCNIFVECRKRDGLEHLRAQLVVTFISLGCLTFFTVDALRESWATAQVCWGWVPAPTGEVEEDVNAYIVLVFALLGLLFDLASLISFWRSAKKEGGKQHLNMATALLHVGADFLRSTTTLIMSLLIIFAHYDGTCTDATASLIVGATILFGAAGGIFSWLRKFSKYVRKGS